MLRLYLLLFGAVGALAQASCPPLKLPWGTFVATLTFVSRRRPVGKLRFSPPAYPPSSSDPSLAPNVSISCNAIDAGTPCGGEPGQGCIPPNPLSKQDEDCLFLDIYVPLSVFVNKRTLPVIVWFYGGAFVFGSKTQADPSVIPLYDGTGLVEKDESAIFVTGNYRLGAFGWLAGTYMEHQAQPNVGLLDQRAILHFIQDHISLLYGDPTRVSIWGESAGASSIMHHLIMPQDRPKPLFRNALLQSPAYQWLWDRNGSLNNTYTEFARLVNCTDGTIDCLRGKSQETLSDANKKLFQEDAACKGIFPIGPAVDGKLVKDLAVNLINSGKGINLESILVSHVHLEVPYQSRLDKMSFIPYPIRQDPQNASKFDDFLDGFAGGDQYAGIKSQIRKQYPATGVYSDQIARAAAVIANASFMCHTRFLIDAYQEKIPQNTFALDYAFGMQVFGKVYNASVHGSDLAPLFRRKDSKYQTLLSCLLNTKSKPILDLINGYIKNSLTPGMQTYFLNQAIDNDPGTQRFSRWHPVENFVTCPNNDGTCVGNVMKTQATITPWGKQKTIDPQTSSKFCDFWKETAQNLVGVSRKHGYTMEPSFESLQKVSDEGSKKNLNMELRR